METPSQKRNSVKVSNFLVPVLVMFVGGWIGGLVAPWLMPNESVVHIGTLVYLFLADAYIFSRYSNLSNKCGDGSMGRSIFVLVSGFVVIVLAFFTYAADNIGMAVILFFASLALMIIDSILDTITK